MSCYTTQIVFPDQITFVNTSGSALTNGLSLLRIGSAQYTLVTTGGATNSTALGGGCETICCSPCSVTFTVSLEEMDANGAVTDLSSACFTVNFMDCCATIPTVTLTGTAGTLTLQGATATLSCSKDIRTATILGLSVVKTVA